MLRVTLKGVLNHRVRFLLTAFAVMLGVSLVSGTYVLTDSINQTFDKIVQQASSGVDVSVRGVASDVKNADGTTLRNELPISYENQLKAVPGVQRVSPDLSGSGVLVNSKGTAVRNGGAPTLAFAYDPTDPDTTVHFISGRGPTSIHEIAVEKSTLERADLKVGQQTKALIGNTPQPVTIVGEVTLDTSLAGATLILVDQQTALKEYAPDGKVPSFTLDADPGISQAALRQRVATVLPPDAEAVTGATIGKEAKDQFDQLTQFISTFLLVFAGISLFVGAFIIANTFSMLVAQRTRELALLRAVGASKAQVRRVVLGEAALLGLFGSILGLGVGIGLAAGLKALFSLAGLDIASGLPIKPRTIIVSLLVGTVVTTLSAIMPALRASRVAPVAALRDDIAAPVGGVFRRGLIGGLFVLVGLVALVPAVTGDTVEWGLVGLGAALLVIGALVAAPATTRPVIRLVAIPFVALYGTTGRLARENSLRNPRRTATTASALMIGLALMSAVSLIAASAKSSVADIVDSQLTADYVLNGGGVAQFPITVAQAVSKLPDVGSVASIRQANMQIGKKSFSAAAGDAQGIQENVKLDVTGGSLNSLAQGQILISRTTAKNQNWRVGQQVSGTIGNLKNQSLTVGAIYEDSQIFGSDLIVPQTLYQQAVPTALQGDFAVFVKAKPGADVAELRNQLNTVVKPYLVVSVQDGSEFTNSAAGNVNQLLTVIYALLALSVIIAVLGIINTLALSVFERTREIGLLRAVGMSRRQLRRMINVESISTAVFGAVLGMVLGLVLGLAVQRGLRSQGLNVLSIPWVSLIVVLIASALAGMIAAILPARRAARLDVLRAITAD
jgi:putative ABC transport system permease protein